MIVDFHTHILPGIDDGCRNTAQSMKLLKEETRQGVDTVVLTPHFYAERTNMEEFLSKRELALSHLKKRIRQREEEQGESLQLPRMLRGAEICYFSGMGESEKVEQLAIEADRGGRVCLLELPFRPWDSGVLRDIELLIRRRELTIVLAHLERYLPLQKDKKVLEAVLDLPVTVQCNAGPLLKLMIRGKVLSLFKEGTAKLLGSDCHNPENRPVTIGVGREMLAKKLGSQVLIGIDETAQSLLGDIL